MKLITELILYLKKAAIKRITTGEGMTSRLLVSMEMVHNNMLYNLSSLNLVSKYPYTTDIKYK